MNLTPAQALLPIFGSGKLLISMVGRNKGDALVDVTKAAGARGGTIAVGRALADNRILQLLSLADMLQDVVFTLMRDEAETVLEAVRRAYRSPSGKISGLAIVLNVEGMLARVPPQNQTTGHSAPETRSENMESGHTLLTVIVNHGYADDVMAEARKAGAAGGTILNARGTGKEEDVRFFGITLVPEKEILLIVAEKSKSAAILAAIGKIPHLTEPGGGIAYAMNEDQFVMLGKWVIGKAGDSLRV